jgi:hypothetical protein
MNFDAVEKIAAAVLYEGYILYPYRPTAIKNRQRWNFGTLYPRVYAQAQRPEEPYHLVAECLATADAQATLDVRLRFLQMIRQPQTPALAWDEAVERTSEHTGISLGELLASPLSLTLQMETDLRVDLTINAQPLPNGACKLRLEVQNSSDLPSGAEADRDEALPFSLVSAHLLLGIAQGQFISLLDPGEAHREAAAACSNQGVFPVLAGEEPDQSIMFCSPIILYDYPKIAPESAGDFFDGTEMDEMLTLRVLTLTDAEKLEMQNGDPRARRILERTEALTSDAMLKAHGVIRGLRDIRGDAS